MSDPNVIEQSQGVAGGSSSATGYAAGDTIEIVSPAAWRGMKATVHWCNGEWMNARLENGIILPLECREVKRPNAALSSAHEA